MKRINILFLLFSAAFFVINAAAQETKKEIMPPVSNQAAVQVKNPQLREELLQRLKNDQDMRKEMASKYAPGQPLPSEVGEKFRAVDRENTEWMKKIVDQYGYPGYSMVGRDGEIAAFLLVQHADKDLIFQKKVLKLLKKAVEQKDATPSSMAYLTDRVLVVDGKPQMYGTQMQMVDGGMKPAPIEDEANVDKRSLELGLPSLAEYLKIYKSYTKQIKN